jgi:hypothetical protein
MYSIIRKDAPWAGTLFLVWGAFGLGLAAVWRVAALGLLLGTREL